MTKKIIKENEVLTNNQIADEVVDIDLSATAKKRFRIDGDNNRILLLNTSDIGMITRLDKAEKDLVKIQESIVELGASMDNSEDFSDMAEKFNEADTKMRELVDFIFDANVSEICAPYGSMYDPFEGKYRFEFIIDRLIPLYENNIAREAKQLSVKSQQYTKKYINKKR